MTIVGVAFATVTAATCLVAYPEMFTGFEIYDDEGYLLISLKGFLEGGTLYSDVFTQYGPFYYEAWGGVFSLTGTAVTHDAGRTATLVVWALSSLLIGASIFRLTRSVLIGIAAQALVFSSLQTLKLAPMHPGAMTCLLLAVCVAIAAATGKRGVSLAMALLGATVAALLLVKINIGVFALASVAVTCAATYPAIASRRLLRLAAEASFVLLPAALMATRLDEWWVQKYCAHVTIAALALVFVLRTRAPSRDRTTDELKWFGLGALGAGLLICAVAVAEGVSLDDLFNGVVLRPYSHPQTYSYPLPLSAKVLAIDLVALAAALAYWHAERSRSDRGAPTRTALAAVSSVVVGVALALSAIGRSIPLGQVTAGPDEYNLGLLAFAWVAVIATPTPIGGVGTRPDFAVRFIAALAISQSLHAFPVAGSQVAWSVFLLVPVGALCVASGIRALAGLPASRRGRVAMRTGMAVAAVVFLAWTVNTTLRRPYEQARDRFDASVPLGLVGSTRMRVSPGDAMTYRSIAAAIERHCTTTLTLPGLNSFYLWTGQSPPTWLNVGYWPALLNDGEQHRVVDAVKSSPRLCLLRDLPTALYWTRNAPLPKGPLLAFTRRDFKPLATFGQYELFRRP